MSTFSKEFLSSSTNGIGKLVQASATLGTVIHTAHATAKDEVWAWAQNSDTTKHKLTIEFGGTTVPDNIVEIFLEPEDGPVLVIPGWMLSGNLLFTAFADSTNKISIFGFVNRIT